MSIDLNETQISQLNSHVDMLYQSRKKLELQQHVYKELQSNLQEFLNKLIIDNNGDTTKQYMLNPETRKLDEIRKD